MRIELETDTKVDCSDTATADVPRSMPIHGLDGRYLGWCTIGLHAAPPLYPQSGEYHFNLRYNVRLQNAAIRLLPWVDYWDATPPRLASRFCCVAANGWQLEQYHPDRGTRQGMVLRFFYFELKNPDYT